MQSRPPERPICPRTYRASGTCARRIDGPPLTVLAFWALFVLLIAELSRRDRNKAAWWLLGLVMASNLPNPESETAYSEVRHYEHQVLLHAPLHFRDQFAQLDQSIVADFRQDAPKDGITAFSPGQRLSRRLSGRCINTRTYNIGGDKNVALAQAHWPASISTLFASDTTTLAGNIERTLADRSARAVVISYVDLLWNAHQWPPSSAELAQARARYAPAVNTLSANPRFVVKERPYYALVIARECTGTRATSSISRPLSACIKSTRP